MTTIRLFICVLFCGLTTLLYGQKDAATFWKTWHYSVAVSLDAGDETSSPGVSLKTWYFIYPRIGLGPVLSYRDISYQYEEKILQTGVEAMYRLPLGKRWNALAALEGGYGHLFVDNAQDKSGGLYFLPKTGIMVETARGIGLYATVGFLRQPWQVGILDFFTEPTITNVVIKRYSISFGLIF